MKPDAKRELEFPRRIKNAEAVLSFGANLQPQGLIHHFPESNLLVDPLGEEVNAIKESHPTL
jgi:hypothetical protein